MFRLHIEHCVDTEENYKKTISRLHSEISNVSYSIIYNINYKLMKIKKIKSM